MKRTRPGGFSALVLTAVGLMSAAAAWTALQGQEVVSSVGHRPDPRGAIFVQLGCNECHAVSGLGVEANVDVGPDLTFAYADVQIRFGFTLGYFLASPRGLMGMVVPTHIELTPVQKDSIVMILKRLYEERRAEMDSVIPSNPPGRFAQCLPAHREP